MALAASCIGALIALQGVLGLLAPGLFFDAIHAIQQPPVLYGAAALRVAIGVVLVLAAARSRFPVSLRIVGALIVLGGALTPWFGVVFAQAVLGWWAQGSGVVRGFALFALVLGGFIAYAATGVPAPRINRSR